MTKGRLLALIPLLGFVALVGYFMVGLSHDPNKLPSALLDRPAPEFTLAGLNGGPSFSKADLIGQVTVVNFFASWCQPCRIEHPMLVRLKSLGVRLVGIDYKDKPGDGERFLDEQGNPYVTVAADPDGRTAIDFGLYGVPETYVVDRQGTIRYRWASAMTADEYERHLAPLLKRLAQ
jgi:cytochrome c biogenesis protein CcmG/thiol:disulfide interchange protein DsbE